MVAGKASSPTTLKLWGLHDTADSSPNTYDAQSGPTVLDVGGAKYTAFATHVMIWPDKYAAFEGHANAPGLGRLAEFIKARTGERVIFRPLYVQDLKQRLRDLANVKTVDFAIYEPESKDASGMLGSLVPHKLERVPYLKLSYGMGIRGKRDHFLDRDVADTLITVAQQQMDFFDNLVITGTSKTLKDGNNKPKRIVINLFNEKIHVAENLPRDTTLPSMPQTKATHSRMRAARQTLDASGALAAALQARTDLQ